MAANNTLPMTANRLVEEFKANYNEVLTDSISDLSLAPILTESSFFAIRNTHDQELFFATSSYLDEFLLSAVPSTVTFVEDRLKLWAEEALDFARKNIGHESFVEIFSSSLQYDTVIQNLIRLDTSGKFLREYFNQLQIHSAYIGNRLPEAFVAAVASAAKGAVQPALTGLAHDLKIRRNLTGPRPKAKVAELREIRSSPSFLNEKGTIPFAENSGKFKIQPNSELEHIAQYRPVVDRAIRKLVEARTFQRIDNKDRVLSGLLSEYHNEVRRPTNKIRIPILWTCGLEIQDRIVRQASVADSDEKLDEEDLFDLRRLLVSHNLFLNCFSQSVALLKDVEASAAIYQRIDTASKRLSPTILREASEDEDFVEEETANLIKRSVPSNVDKDIDLNKGQVAISFGLLRGLLHAAGGHLLKGIEKISEKISVDVTSKLIIDMLRADASFAATLSFINRQVSALAHLSDQIPVWFGYLRHLLSMLGINS